MSDQYTPIARLDLPQDETALAQQVQVWDIYISARRNEIQVIYDVVRLSPNGKVAAIVQQNQNYRRYNRPAVMSGDDIVTPANNKFDELRDSQIGKAIEAMIASDLKDWPNMQQI